MLPPLRSVVGHCVEAATLDRLNEEFSRWDRREIVCLLRQGVDFVRPIRIYIYMDYLGTPYTYRRTNMYIHTNIYILRWYIGIYLSFRLALSNACLLLVTHSFTSIDWQIPSMQFASHRQPRSNLGSCSAREGSSHLLFARLSFRRSQP